MRTRRSLLTVALLLVSRTAFAFTGFMLWNPPTKTVSTGSTFTMQIQVQARTEIISETDGLVSFDPTKVQVVSIDPSPAAAAGFTQVWSTAFDNTAGTLNCSIGVPLGNPGITISTFFNLCTVTFTAAGTPSSSSLTFTLSLPRQSNIYTTDASSVCTGGSGSASCVANGTLIVAAPTATPAASNTPTPANTNTPAPTGTPTNTVVPSVTNTPATTPTAISANDCCACGPVTSTCANGISCPTTFCNVIHNAMCQHDGTCMNFTPTPTPGSIPCTNTNQCPAGSACVPAS